MLLSSVVLYVFTALLGALLGFAVFDVSHKRVLRIRRLSDVSASPANPAEKPLPAPPAEKNSVDM
ncbi:hypothetical protein SLS56_008498 [Neofusicoccum ribis]|uniref:Copper transporter n=1 Tax=Neofusicoccum ribis TaxID=45134 RepID=A0ABR3SLE3_9PEZI